MYFYDESILSSSLSVNHVHLVQKRDIYQLDTVTTLSHVGEKNIDLIVFDSFKALKTLTHR